MHKIIISMLFCFILIKTMGQSQKKLSLYLSGQFHHTLYDRMKSENPFGFGVGLQLFFNNTAKLKPILEISAEAFPSKSKVLFLNPDGTSIDNIDIVANLFAGVSYYPIRQVYVAFSAGPGIANGNVLLGIRPSLGFYFSPNQKCMGRVSYTNLFHRDKFTQKDLGVLSFSIGIHLF